MRKWSKLATPWLTWCTSTGPMSLKSQALWKKFGINSSHFQMICAHLQYPLPSCRCPLPLCQYFYHQLHQWCCHLWKLIQFCQPHLFLIDAYIIYQPEENTLVLILNIHNLMPNYGLIFSGVHFNFSWNISIIPMVCQNNIIAIGHFSTYENFLVPILKTVSTWVNVSFAR